MGEIEMGVERGGGAKAALFDPSMALVQGGVLRGKSLPVKGLEIIRRPPGSLLEPR